MKISPLILACIGLSLVAATTIYRWVDEQGRTHYTDRPPEGVDSESVELETGEAADGDQAGDAPEAAADQAAARRERRAAEREATAATEAERQREAASLTARCTAARTRLAVLEEQLPVYRDDRGAFRVRWKWAFDAYEGERQYLDDGERAAEIERARNDINANCENPDDATEQARARAQWLRAEECASAKAELAWLEAPRLRTPDSELDRKRAEVARLCGD